MREGNGGWEDWRMRGEDGRMGGRGEGNMGKVRTEWHRWVGWGEPEGDAWLGTGDWGLENELGK